MKIRELEGDILGYVTRYLEIVTPQRLRVGAGKEFNAPLAGPKKRVRTDSASSHPILIHDVA